MFNFKKGQRLAVQLKNVCYIGDFHNANPNHTRIELTNVQDFSTGGKFSGVQRYYRSEIESLTPLFDSSITEGVTEGGDTTTPSSEPIICLISAAEFDNIVKSILSAQYLYNIDRAYHSAIEDIKVQPYIGLAVELVTEAGVSLITVCVPTTQKIYIFDIIYLGHVPNDLKAILQAKTPQKILHNCHAVAVALKRNMNVELKSIFDTLVAHVSLDSAKAVSLKECLHTHMSFPPSLWIHNSDIRWLTRPLDDERKKYAAQNAAYLPQLYSFLLHERMLKKFHEQCNDFAGVHLVDNEKLEEAFFDLCCKIDATVTKIAPMELNFDDVAVDMLKNMKIP